MKGVVIKSTGSWYHVLTAEGHRLECRARGRMRLDDSKETNPIAVGDFVEIEGDSIMEVLPRTNHILRQSVKQSAQSHVLAANVTQAMLVVTMIRPRTSTGFIDRFLVTAEAYSVPQVLCFNKRDLLSEADLAAQQELIETYRAIGIKSVALSFLHDDLTPVMSLLQGKTTLMAGHSGVGKSTLLNKVSPNVHQKVGEVSEYSEKGTHVTTFAEMFALNTDTRVIDTPGVKEWGLSDMEPGELSDNFPEMRDLRSACKFGYRCLHLQEPKCAVVEAVKEGRIALQRYESYVSMILQEDNRR